MADYKRHIWSALVAEAARHTRSEHLHKCVVRKARLRLTRRLAVYSLRADGLFGPARRINESLKKRGQ